MTTIGELISTLYTKFEQQFHDHEVAAIATELALADLLRARKRAPRPRAT
ncbi:MAG: hypothetical protein NT062_10450 [Proteobacteria bacterium]|nr:hypothetical protein [Pseudomonadota bacterium]